MVKQRMTALDVRASVEEMRSELLGLRLLNVYDINPKMFLFKFGHGENKRTLLLESGIRMHLTQLVREKPKVPSQFTLKLRKHVRAWRLDSVTQLQHDRTVDFRFGVGEGASYHIIIELFSKGNVVLTDHEYRILLLLRTHKDDDIKMFVRELYPVTRPFEEQQEKEVMAQSESGKEKEEEQRRTKALRQEWHTVFARHADYETIRSTLSAVHHFGPALADHILTVTGVKNVKKGEITSDAEKMFKLLLPGMLQAWEITFSPLPGGGYLISNHRQRKESRKGGQEASSKIEEDKSQAEVEKSVNVNVADESQQQMQAVQYDDFTPVLLAQYSSDGVVTSFLKSFGSVCDAFFLYTETEKIEQHNEKKTTSVISKRNKFERDHQRRLNALEMEEQENQRKGECIIQNAVKIDEAIGLINGALAAGIQWDALRSLLKRRHAEGHPVAYMVHDLFLERNSISVLVESNEQEDEGEEDCDVTPMVIEVELSKTAYANATTYFSKMKSNRIKYEKTVAATAKALAGAEKKGERLAAKQKTKKAIVKERRRFWWEKFSWFRTSCGDFVLQGKDLQTTEILVRRVMQLGDVFVHCDVDGALPCVLRPIGSAWTTAFVEDVEGDPQEGCQAKTCRIHMTSLDEAGAWCVSRSSAWEGKFSVAAWWVHASQINGGTASGCYLFDGEKHYLRPQPVTFACGLLFRVSTRRIDPNDRDELPNFISEGELRPRHLEEEGEEGEYGAFLPPDSATTLHPLPSFWELRGPRRHPQPQQQRQGRQAAEGKAAQKGMKASKKATSTPSTTTTTTTQTAIAGAERGGKGSGAGGGTRVASAPSPQKSMQQLTKHQRRKLKKIQEKYKDQDEEDRLYGALLNGNQMSKVQLGVLALQREKEKRHELFPPKTFEEKNFDEKQEEEVEEVTEFIDEDKSGETNSHNESSISLLPNNSVDGKEGQKEEEEEEEVENEKHNAGQPQSKTRAVATSVEESCIANDEELRREWQYFTSQPKPMDNIEYALAVCAPMSCVISYKYRAELSFGNAKKGQVTTSLQGHFLTMTKGVENASEVRAVESLDANVVMEQLRGNLRCLTTRQKK
ncbi:putative translation-associated element 2 [Trypanosoma cruzi]|uniref:Putative translation-associated element 2 n=2 Tax=Trypanosoma cruzi TaxID=5693 RepID=A0A2V2UPC0_TRYCR|nr:putative translation-associated element 2 [Trypanosoma cruzi]